MPLLQNVRFVPVNDPAALRNAVTETTAAIILEPIQGEGGVRPITQEFANAVGEACRRTGTLLIADEVQCGLGRTGQPFYFQKLGMRSGSGFRRQGAGAAASRWVPRWSKKKWRQRSHSATMAPPSAETFWRAAPQLVCLDQLTAGLMDHVKTAGAHLESKLRAMQKKHPAIVDVRGAGLMWGIELNDGCRGRARSGDQAQACS